MAALKLNRIIRGDCIAELAKLPKGFIDLAFADPPFNIGYDYDEYDDKRSCDDYLAWSKRWMQAVYRVLKPDGTFWLAIGDEYAAELKVIATREIGFTCRNWVVWYYTFGVNCKYKFTRSHTHLFYFVKDPKAYTFNADDPAVRVRSARQLVYGDKRANPKGRLPDDTWILRPQDLPDGFSPDSDTWYFPRVAGTFRERMGFHGCQMPEQLLARIIRACSNGNEEDGERDLVLDPFAGSGTTLAVAKKLGRDYLGIELSAEYKSEATERLRTIKPGDPLDGVDDPLTSVPNTANGVVRTAEGRRVKNSPSATNGGTRGKANADVAQSPGRRDSVVRNKRIRGYATDERIIVDAYSHFKKDATADYLLADPQLNEEFLERCQLRGAIMTATECNRLLLRLRKAGRLPRSNRSRRSPLSKTEWDDVRYATEIALHMVGDHEQLTLDDILCNPDLAAQFDTFASKFAPGLSAFQFRWAALRDRKKACQRRLADSAHQAPDVKEGRRGWVDLTAPFSMRLVERGGLYLLREPTNQKNVYVGETSDLCRRLNSLSQICRGEASSILRKTCGSDELVVRILWYSNLRESRLSLQSREIRTKKTLLNWKQLIAA